MAWKSVSKNYSSGPTRRWNAHDPAIIRFDALPACDIKGTPRVAKSRHGISERKTKINNEANFADVI